MTAHTMTPTRTLLALVVAHLLAAAAFAQSEYGRASGGTIEGITKGPSQFSGSLTLSQSVGSSGGRGYEASLGGELLDDRLWFFGAASVLPQVRFSTPGITAFDAKATANPVDWTSVTASFHRLQQPGLATMPQPYDGSLPSSFLSLRSTSILSDRMILDFSFSAAR